MSANTDRYPFSEMARIQYTTEQLAKMGIKIHGEKKRSDLKPSKASEGVEATDTGRKTIQAKDGKKNRQKSAVKTQGTDCTMLIILIRQETGLEAVTEYAFHPLRKWRFDIAIPTEKIAVEIEGGIWMEGGGAHSRPANIIRDIEKYNSAVIEGWKVIRVVPADIMKSRTIEMIKKLIKLKNERTGSIAQDREVKLRDQDPSRGTEHEG